MFKRISILGFVGLMAFAAPVAPAAVFVSDAVSFVQGAVPSDDVQFNNANSVLGMPQGTTGAPEGFPSVVSPFSPAFDPDQLTVIGLGGHLTLKFPRPVVVGSGPAVGVFSNVGLEDVNYPNGAVGNPITTFGGGQAKVRVSVDGIHWVNLGLKTFDMPENYYLNAGPYDVTAPASPQVAHFAKPYTGAVDDFAGDSYSQIVSKLGVSAGGQWLDLSSSGLTEINYIKFTVPTNLADGSKLAISAVSVAHGHVGVAPALRVADAVTPAVPLPPAVWSGAIGLAAVVLWQARRRAMA